jgi:hypothetical protein
MTGGPVGNKSVRRLETTRVGLVNFVLVAAHHFMWKNWGATQSSAFQRGLKEKGWDPLLTDRKKIKQIIQNDAATFAEVKPWFDKTNGGEKNNNNNTQYKNSASEYITLLAKIGIRRT